MIPPVRPKDKQVSDFYRWVIDTDMEEEFPTSPAFLFYAPDWLSSSTTDAMDAEQEGWLIRLLSRAWWNGKPQCTLPANDEESLKIMAKYKPSKGVTTKRLRLFLEEKNITQESLEIAEDYEFRWNVVRKEFVEVPGFPEYLHNPKLTKIFMESIDLRKRRKKASGDANRSRQLYKNKGDSTERNINGVQTETERNIQRSDYLPLGGPNGDRTVITSASYKESNTKDLKVNQKGLDEIVLQVFEYWRMKMGKNEGAKLDDNRKKTIVKALRTYPLSQIMLAIDGCSLSDFYMGREPGKPTKHNDITLILRNSTNIEKFIDFTLNNPNTKGNSNGKPDIWKQLEEKYSRSDDDSNNPDVEEHPDVDDFSIFDQPIQ
jgi:hypothetical protein